MARVQRAVVLDISQLTLLSKPTDSLVGAAGSIHSACLQRPGHFGALLAVARVYLYSGPSDG